MGVISRNEAGNPAGLFFFGESNYGDTDMIDKIWPLSAAGSGEGKINNAAVRAVEGLKGDPSWVVLEKAPEYSIERWNVNSGNYMGFYSGGQGDDDDKFNNPIDVTIDNADNVYVLDILSDSKPRIKVFNKYLESLGGMDVSTQVTGTPIACDWDAFNDRLHILHSQGVAAFDK